REHLTGAPRTRPMGIHMSLTQLERACFSQDCSVRLQADLGRPAKAGLSRFVKNAALITLIWLALAPTVVRAHDPGLSSLDVTVKGETIAVRLAMAASDVSLIEQTRGGDARQALGALAREAVRLFVDEKPIPSI